jgi:hypothetical protein
MFAFVVVPARLASADSNEPEPLRCTFELSIDLSLPNPHWQGTVSGDMEGEMSLYERFADNYVVGATEHFFEDFVISTDNGDITGNDMGIWNFATFKFRAHGFVTDATSDGLEYLVGYKAIMTGFTSEFPPTAPNTIVTATGSIMLVPA